MLARPEPGTTEDILLWLDSKDPRREYNWGNVLDCPAYHYMKERLGTDMADPKTISPPHAGDWEIYGVGGKHGLDIGKHASMHPWTYGALAERCRAAWRPRV